MRTATDQRQRQRLAKAGTLVLFLGAVFLGAVGCGGSQPATTDEKPGAASTTKTTTPLTPVLAKAHLADAAAEARKWRPDAFVIQVAGSGVSDEGKAKNWWEYGAYSPSAKTCLVITFIRGKASTQESGGEQCESDALGEIIDSDQAIKIARENGIAKQDVSMVAMASSLRKGQSVWSVIEEGMRNPGNMTMDIDAKTGAVLNKVRTP